MPSPPPSLGNSEECFPMSQERPVTRAGWGPTSSLQSKILRLRRAALNPRHTLHRTPLRFLRVSSCAPMRKPVSFLWASGSCLSSGNNKTCATAPIYCTHVLGGFCFFLMYFSLFCLISWHPTKRRVTLFIFQKEQKPQKTKCLFRNYRAGKKQSQVPLIIEPSFYPQDDTTSGLLERKMEG